MATTSRIPTKDQYNVGWICALPVERAAANAMLDERYNEKDTKNYNQVPSDTNHYSFGRVKDHYVVITSLPAGVHGTTSATMVAGQMMRSFTSIQIGLMVGIGGGVPTPDSDIRLGDVVVSQPQGCFGGVVQWDRGKKTAGGKFERTGQLNKPPHLLLIGLAAMQAEFEMVGFDLPEYFRESLANHAHMLGKFDRPHNEKDELYRAEYDHIGNSRDCVTCDGKLNAYSGVKILTSKSSTEPRDNRRPPTEVKFHYGTIASGNSLIKDGNERDRISLDLGGILCFEMEAAGLMDGFPCLVIRGICDYADSHKNKRWQRYAAATAACYAKKLLSIIPRSEQLARQQYRLPFHESLPNSAEIFAQQMSTPVSQWTSGSGQPIGSPYLSQWTSEFERPIRLPQNQRPPGLVHLIEQQRGRDSDQHPSGFVRSTDHNRSNHQPSAQSKVVSFVNPSASGYNRSSSHYKASSSDQLRREIDRPSAYPTSATGQQSSEGVSPTQTHSWPPLAPNKIGHNDSDKVRSKGNSESSGGIHKSLVKSQPGRNKGYTKPPNMIYPQSPKLSHPDPSRQPSHGSSTPPIPLRPLPRKQPQYSPPRTPSAPYSTGPGHESKAAGASGSGVSISFDTSHQGSPAMAPYQGDTKYSDEAQPARSYFQAQQQYQKDHKLSSHTNDPKPAANRHRLTRKPLAQSHEQQSHLKEPKSSINRQEQSHHDDLSPFSKHSADEGHLKEPKSSTSGQDQSHHGDSNPSSKHGADQGHTKEQKPSEKGGKNSTHTEDEADRPDHGYDDTDTPGDSNNNTFGETVNSSGINIHLHLDEKPNDNDADQEYPIGSQINPQNALDSSDHGQSDPTYGLEHSPYGQNRPPYNQEYPPYRQEYLPFAQEHPPYTQKYHPYRQEHPSYTPEHPPYNPKHPPYTPEHPSYAQKHPPSDQQYHTYAGGDHNAQNDIGPRFGGEAAEKFSRTSMGEDQHSRTSQAIEVSPHEQDTTHDHQAYDERGPGRDERGPGEDEKRSDRKSESSHVGDFTHSEQVRDPGGSYQENDADDGCGWCCGGGSNNSDDEGCCSGMWTCCGDGDNSHDREQDSCGCCCGGGSNNSDDEGCCGGMWTCCGDGDGDKSDDGEKNNCCSVM